MRKLYDLWTSRSPQGGVEFALIEHGKFASEEASFEGAPELLTSFEADSYEEAAQKRNDFLGWGKYHSMED